MDVGDKLATVLTAFASTLLTDSPIQGILDHLVESIVEIFPVAGAGVTFVSDSGLPTYFAASSPSALVFEHLQADLCEGPRVAAHASGEIVEIPDLRVETRFARFSQEGLGAGLAAVFAFPLRHGESRLGALDLYRNTTGPLDSPTLKSTRMLANVAALYLMNASERKELKDSLHQYRDGALHDPLTGLANRVLLVEVLEKALLRNSRSDALAGVLYCDLDQFKRINDIYGHRIGDEMLMGVAERLKSVLRPSDTLARLSGDEFVILCESLQGRAEAELIAARALGALSEPFSLSIGTVTTTASIGIALANRTALSSADLLHDADMAMYRAKRSGGGTSRIIDLGARPIADGGASLEDILLNCPR